MSSAPPTPDMAIGPAYPVVAPGGEPTIFEQPPVRRGSLVRLLRGIGSVVGWFFGLTALILALAFAATVPIVQLVSFGYLLEVSGRIVRTGRLRDGIFGIRQAAQAGTMVLGAWLVLLPVRVAASLAASARLVDPGGPVDRAWTIGLWILAGLVTLHVIGACWRGGKLRHFLWPAPLRVARLLLRRSAYAEARDAVWEFVIGMRLPYFFWLGLRGLLGSLVWLAIPISLLAADRRLPVINFLGGLTLMVAAMYLPFVQTRFAAENRFRALFEPSAARSWFRRAPLAFALSLGVMLALSLPLNLFKIEILPQDAAWMPGIFFVALALPSRLFVGWACGYADRRARMRNWFSRQLARLAILALTGAYAFIAFFTQYILWYGIGSLYEQHAFLLPAPFLNY